MMKLPQLKSLMKEHGITFSYMNKPEMLRTPVEKGILPETELDKPAKEKREVLPEYEYLKTIRNNPLSVKFLDKETNEVVAQTARNRSARTMPTYLAHSGKHGAHGIFAHLETPI